MLFFYSKHNHPFYKISQLIMNSNKFISFAVFALLISFFGIIISANATETIAKPQLAQKQLVYLVSDLRIPFWNIMSRGIKNKSQKLGYKIDVYTADNLAKQELENTFKVIRDKVDGIIISPTNSSAAVTILKFADKAGIPVVISDIGTESGEYVSYISSDNFTGAYLIGKVLTRKMNESGWQDGTVGIIAIPQKRENGRARTAGFMSALDEAGIKTANLKQQVTFSYNETYNFSQEIIKNNPDLRALFLQGSDRYQAALDAINDTGNKEKILLICFDAEPEFIELIPKGILVGAAMQQPLLMGELAVETMDKYLKGQGVKKEHQLPILAISADNIDAKLDIIKRNVLGILLE
jgi:ABC-type sugar transport system substrate-binding protein